jgi:hypothetical protein
MGNRQVQDPIEDLLNAMVALESSATGFATDVRALAAEEGRLASATRFRGALRSGLLGSIAAFNRAAGARTHDVELSLTRERITRLIGDWSFEPFRFETDQVSITARAVGRPSVRFARADQGIPVEDALELEVPLEVATTAADARRLRLRFTLQPKLGSSPRVKFVQITAPRFVDQSGGIVDPLADLPIADRRRLRDDIQRELTARLEAFEFSLPQINIGQRAITPTPHTFFISRDLVLLDRHLQKRRAASTFAPPVPNGFDQQVRVKREHVQGDIQQSINAMGAAVTAIEFRPNHIFLTARKTESGGVLWATVTVTVDMDYRVTVAERSPARLYANANWLEWRRNIKAERCWPFCGKAIREAKKQSDPEIERAKHQSFPFADLSATATRAGAAIDRHGMVIFTRAR